MASPSGEISTTSNNDDQVRCLLTNKKRGACISVSWRRIEDGPECARRSSCHLNCTYKFNPEEKAIINVGSVGQPRDHDPRASYAIMYPDRVEFHRVEYDIEKTASMIRAIPELTDWLADRLLEGR